MMTEAELDELAEDIAQHGLQHPIVWLGGKLLDGRNRVAAVHRIKDQRRRDEIVRHWRNGRDCLVLVSCADPTAYVVSANLHRRHLDREDKRKVVEALLKAKPERSDNSTAKIAKVSDKTVASVRRDMEARSEIPNVETRTDAAGRQQPARKLAPHAREITQEQLAAIRDEAPHESEPPTIDQLADRKDALRVLDEAIRLLSQRRAEVLALPIKTRIGRAMSLLDALGIGIDQLVPAGRR